MPAIAVTNAEENLRRKQPPFVPKLQMWNVDVRFLLMIWFLVVVAGSHNRARPHTESAAGLGTYPLLFILSIPAVGVLLRAVALTIQNGWIPTFLQAVAFLCAVSCFAAIAAKSDKGWTNLLRSPLGTVCTLARSRTNWFAIPAVALAAAVTFWSQQQPQSDGRPRLIGDAFDKWYLSQPRLPVPDERIGAPITIVEFVDYQCPACKEAKRYYAPLFAEFTKEFAGSIRLVKKDLPLDPECNPWAKAEHHWACEAAVAVRLAAEQRRSDQLERWLWDNQAKLTPADVFRAADEIGGVKSIRQRYSAALEQVKADISLAHSLNIKATPTYLINGVRLGFTPAQNWRRAVHLEFARVKATASLLSATGTLTP